MKRREAVGSSSIRTFIRGAYKGTGHKCSEFVARLLGTRKESLSMVVFRDGAVEEIVEI